MQWFPGAPNICLCGILGVGAQARGPGDSVYTLTPGQTQSSRGEFTGTPRPPEQVPCVNRSPLFGGRTP